MQTPFTDAERQAFLGTMKDVYRLFTSKVAAGRKLDPAKVAALAEGRVFTGRMAREAGLVDRLGTLDDAVDEARKLAGIKADESVDRILLPEPRGLFDDLFGATGQSTDPLARALASAAGVPAVRGFLRGRIGVVPELLPLAQEVDTLLEITSGRLQLMVPARIRLR
jgi:protease-4